MGEWQHGLCGCFDNFGICIITYFVPCVTAGKNAEAVGESCCLYGFLSMTCVGLWSMTMVRGKIRQAKGIEVSKGSGAAHLSCFRKYNIYCCSSGNFDKGI